MLLRGPLIYALGMDRIENITSNSSSIVDCISVAVETCVLSRCLRTAVSLAPLSTRQTSCHSIISVSPIYIPRNETVKKQIKIFWDMMYSLAERYQHFRGTCCFYLQARRWRQQVPLKCWYLSTKVHSIAS
jgi:hypothetical protein